MDDQAAVKTYSKAEKFKYLAERRVSNALRTIKQIGNLSRRTTYDYTPEQISKMFDTMHAELENAEAKFQPAVKGGARQKMFSFDGAS